MRQPTGTSFARARGFNKESMDEFYDTLEKIYEEKKFSADRIYNVDETGLYVYSAWENLPDKLRKESCWQTMNTHPAYITMNLGVILAPGNGGFNVKSVARGAMQNALGYQKRLKM